MRYEAIINSKREIVLTEAVSVQYDMSATHICIHRPAYLEGYTAFINLIRPDGMEDRVDFTETTGDIEWSLNDFATAASGALLFSISFVKQDGTVKFHTIPATIIINDTLSTEPTPTPEQQSWIEQKLEEIAGYAEDAADSASQAAQDAREVETALESISMERTTGGAIIHIGSESVPLYDGEKGDTGATGPQGETGPQGAQGPAGADGVSPEASVERVTGGAKVTITDARGTTEAMLTDGPQGPTGQQGPKGDTGNGIASITKTGTAGLVDTYTITYYDGTTTTYQVTNGADGEDYILTNQDKADIAGIVEPDIKDYVDEYILGGAS